MYIPKKGSSHDSKIYSLITFVVFVAGMVSTGYIAFLVHNTSKENLITNVNALAQVLQYEDFSSLAGSEADLKNSTYVHIKNVLISVRSVNKDIKFIYLNGLRPDGKMFFYADSEDIASEDYSPPGQLYPEATPAMFAVFKNGNSGFEAASDRWGYWFSAYAPVLDRTGKIVALVGMDVPGQQYITNTIVYSSLPLLLMVIILILLLASRNVRKRENQFLEQKEEFLSIASHEIRTPLTGIRWETEKILTDKSRYLDEYMRYSIGRIHSSCVDLVERINNLLSMTQIDDVHNIKRDSEKIDLKQLLVTVTGVLDLNAQIRGVKFVLDPSISRGIYVMANLEYTRQILTNLVSNAVKYTNKNTEVHIAYKETDHKYEISVFDHGDGISSEDMDIIFEGHRTEKARHSDVAGNGFGLYMSRKMARMQGGDIIVVSEVGKGSIFTLSLLKR